jgi:hypothetical protein
MKQIMEYYEQFAISSEDTDDTPDIAEVVWHENSDYVVPWASAEDLDGAKITVYETSYPDNCGLYSASRR